MDARDRPVERGHVRTRAADDRSRDDVGRDLRLPRRLARAEVEGTEEVLAAARPRHQHPAAQRRGLGEKRVAQPFLPEQRPARDVHRLERAALGVEECDAIDHGRGRGSVVACPEFPGPLARLGVQGVDLVAAEAAAEDDSAIPDRWRRDAACGLDPRSPAGEPPEFHPSALDHVRLSSRPPSPFHPSTIRVFASNTQLPRAISHARPTVSPAPVTPKPGLSGVRPVMSLAHREAGQHLLLSEV